MQERRDQHHRAAPQLHFLWWSALSAGFPTMSHQLLTMRKKMEVTVTTPAEQPGTSQFSAPVVWA